jgi:hypothetical protein
MRRQLWLAWFGLLIAAGPCIAADVAKTAARIDELLAADNYGAPAGESSKSSKPAALVDDSTFLRRASLDIGGELPMPEQVTAFVLDPSADKRAKLVNRLLQSPRYGQSWAHYWRDVIYMRRSDERALLGQRATTEFLARQFNQGTRWDQIARQFITATGDITEHGECGIILAQMADPSNVTAEVSRIFMGVQIQCAQCHNHPFDRWKREQFHEMAAFFPRIGIRRAGDQMKRSFEVVSLNRPVKKRSPADTEGAKLEHFMPDLNDPQAEGTLMKPIFYSTGQKLKLGTSDEQRRTQLADWMTARGNRWFAKAFVNRLWGELVGRGFQEPLDDLGPDRKPAAPKTFEYVADQFAASGYDHKWLMRVITATDAYQRTSRPRHDMAEDQFAASCTQRLRGDQLFNALSAALGIDESDVQRRRGGAKAALRYAANGPRGQVNQTFGYDPSDRRDEVAGSIPQALFLMNSAELNRAVSVRNPRGTLGQLLDREPKDENVVFELYLRTLAREPKTAEVKKCLDYVHELSDRTVAFEDIQWALINSTEFLYRK